ncbi:MAG: DNA polymerase III subunit delta [Acidobacteria bacterium]|nr:MAG: DNA polymerase III subunit delta [Acidobacteria bacterium 13_1_40CM_2_68_10]OLE66162.1 MAG: DNA polymerase III subunit delta [Acidobacteria bacterium 13_1_20CM_2_68_14]PYT37489.1 MAG: DNA polymerase III subunit delta [Acidobacteriota bacterium]
MPVSLSFARFQEDLRTGRVAPTYLFEGEEAYFHDQGIHLLERAILPEGALAMNRDAVRGDDISLIALLDLAQTYPMGNGRRLVVVRDADALRADNLEPLKIYLKTPNPRACLAFSDVKFDRRRALYRVLADHATRVDCGPLDEARAAVFVRERLRSRGFGIGADLASAIASGLAGAGLGRVDAELEKLMTALGAPRPVEAADLAILADVPRVDDVFRLAAHAARGERGEAVGILRALVREGEDPIKILGGLSWYFRNALRAMVADTRRLPPRETTALYGIDRGRIDRFARELGRTPAEDLREALAYCLKADRELKGMGARDPAHALERLVHHVGRRARRPA